MKQEILIIEMGKFTGEIGLEVYERFKREVDGQWKKIQETQIPKSRALRSQKAIEEMIVVKALDRFLTPLSTKERLEMKTVQNISDTLLKVLINMDVDYSLEELETMCRERELSVKGHKKLLAWRLLRHEIEKTI